MRLSKDEYEVVKGFLLLLYRLSLDDTDYYLNELKGETGFVDLSLNKSSKVTYYTKENWG